MLEKQPVEIIPSLEKQVDELNSNDSIFVVNSLPLAIFITNGGNNIVFSNKFSQNHILVKYILDELKNKTKNDSINVISDFIKNDTLHIKIFKIKYEESLYYLEFIKSTVRAEDMFYKIITIIDISFTERCSEISNDMHKNFIKKIEEITNRKQDPEMLLCVANHNIEKIQIESFNQQTDTLFV